MSVQAVKVTLAIGPRRERQGASTRASESASASAIGARKEDAANASASTVIDVDVDVDDAVGADFGTAYRSAQLHCCAFKTNEQTEGRERERMRVPCESVRRR